MAEAAEQFDAFDNLWSQTRVLVVDDSPAQRRLLKVLLQRWGYDVVEAGSGAEALELYRSGAFEAVISDWMMPEMSGLELCHAIRSETSRGYAYFILLTGKSEKPDIAKGLDVGADDFLSKPVSSDELVARLRAGERILRMERQLREKNREIGESLNKIARLYDAIDSDLAEARNLQHSLVQDRTRRFGEARVSLMLRASGHVGGDLVGCFPIDDGAFGVFAIDVSGHGVASALLTARLAGLLSSPDPEQNVALYRRDDGSVAMYPPSEAATRLNSLYFKDIRAEQYLTMALGRIETGSGDVTMALCGHPRPVVQDRDGATRFVEGSGLPVGLFEDAVWEDVAFHIPSGGRLFLTSDGMTECAAPDGALLDEEGLARIMRDNHALSGHDFLEAMIWDLNAFAGDRDFEDDVSGVLIETGGTLSEA